MKDQPKHLSKRQRREEMMARANRARQGGAAGETLSGLQGAGASKATGPWQDRPASVDRDERQRKE